MAEQNLVGEPERECDPAARAHRVGPELAVFGQAGAGEGELAGPGVYRLLQRPHVGPLGEGGGQYQVAMDRGIPGGASPVPAERLVDQQLPFTAKTQDRVRIVEVRVSLAAVVGTDPDSLAVPLDQAVQVPEADPALGLDRVRAPIGLSLPDQVDRGELGEAHPVRDTAAVNPPDKRFDATVRNVLMAPGSGIPAAEVAAEDIPES